jgi:hypothetical protein
LTLEEGKEIHVRSTWDTKIAVQDETTATPHGSIRGAGSGRREEVSIAKMGHIGPLRHEYDLTGGEKGDLKHRDWIEILPRSYGTINPTLMQVDDGYRCKEIAVYLRMEKEQLVGLMEAILRHHTNEYLIPEGGRMWRGTIRQWAG